MCQITRSVVGCHKEHLSHQEYFTDPGVDESVSRGAVTSRGKASETDLLGTFSTVDLLAFPALFAAGLYKAAEFLRHQFPMVRA